MKKSATLLIVLALIPSFVSAQSKSVSEFQDKYRDMDNTTFVDISGSLFNFASSIANYVDEDDEDKEEVEAAGRILGAIKAFQVLKVPFELVNEKDIESLKVRMSKEKFEPLMSVKDRDTDLEVLAQGSGSKLENITFLVNTDDDFVLFTFQGTFSMEDVSYLVKNKNSWN